MNDQETGHSGDTESHPTLPGRPQATTQPVPGPNLPFSSVDSVACFCLRWGSQWGKRGGGGGENGDEGEHFKSLEISSPVL